MTLRSYSDPVNLARFDARGWMTTDENLDYIGDYLYEVTHHEILSRQVVGNLNRADSDIVEMCFGDDR